MYKQEKRLFNIRPTMLSLLTLLCLIIIVSLLSLQYYFSKELALKAISENFNHISQKVKDRIEILDIKNNNIISMLEFNQGITQKANINKQHDLLELITKILEKNSHIYAIYIGNNKNEFYEVINLNISKNLKKMYKVKNEASWLVIKILKIEDKRKEHKLFLDKNLNILKTEDKISTYYPTSRPWYKKAFKTNLIIKTKPYMFTNLKQKGITYAKKLKSSPYVIGLDVSLESLNLFLKKQITYKDEEILLFKDDKKITISSSMKKNKKGFNKILDFTFSNDLNIKQSILKINGKDNFVYVSKLNSEYADTDYLAMILPIKEIMKPYNEKIYYAFSFTVFIMFLLSPIVFYIAKLFVKPINLLEAENRKINNQDFSSVRTVNTRLKEIHNLSSSFVKMSQSIQKHNESQKKLMDSFIHIIASAIDAKSTYTGVHCSKVPLLASMIAQKASENKEGIFKDFTLKTEDEKRELSVAAWLHDCGKVTTPEYVVDKATKLETIYNRIHEIRTRFEVLHRDKTIIYLNNIISGKNKKEEKEKLELEHNNLYKEFEVIASANIGSEFLDVKIINKIEDIAKREWFRHFDNHIGLSKDELSRKPSLEKEILPIKEFLLDDKIEHIIPRTSELKEEYKKFGFKLEMPKDLYNLGEVYNLSIKKGTLTNEERYKINEHVIMSIIMLEQLPFPKNLKNVPEFASAHHETLIGTGYPRQLKKEEMSIPARILAIADIFEALTASDRPYKDAKTLNESIKILSYMVKDKHIDKDIFELFLKSDIHNIYANEHMHKDQIDKVDIQEYISS